MKGKDTRWLRNAQEKRPQKIRAMILLFAFTLFTLASVAMSVAYMNSH